MFGLSTWEIILIAAVALIFIGPDQLPKVAKQVGKGLRQMRGAVNKVDDQVRRAVREATAEAELDEDDDSHMDMKGPRPSAPPTPPPSPSPPISPTAANAPPGLPGSASSLPQRDWKEIARTPIEGRVPMTQPARPAPTTTATAPATPDSPAPPPADSKSEPSA
ncbi:MAG: twin-arginine translocase TatA/TatE family subunit [Deltaproteobacteria bacterium]|nr:twin-arginine translocase TatA/TatE family subunit [Deltaproteobacteria bacterium]